VTVRAVVVAAVLSIAFHSSAVARQRTSAALVDRHLTVGAGATIATAAGEALGRAGDALVPHRIFPEDGPVRRSTNITYRLLKLTLLDSPQEQLLRVANHELFGHGGRVRERFDGPVGYRIGVARPYGRGGGSTTFVLDREPWPQERLSIHVAGMEASAVAADLLGSRAMLQGRMTARDALRYLGFELDTLSYVLSTDDEGEEPGHDVADFLEMYNGLAAEAGVSPLRTRTLGREALASLANPVLTYAAWGVGRYVATGASDVVVPMFTIAGVRYLPLVRYRLTPFGTEWSLVNVLHGRVRPTQVELRIGRGIDARPWGVAIAHRGLPAWRDWTADVAVNVWRQPELSESSDDPFPSPMRLGAHLRGRLERPLVPMWFSRDRATLIVDVGLKSAGFVPGEQLAAGFVTRAGVGLSLAH
jgi:hypothetical protein